MGLLAARSYREGKRKRKNTYKTLELNRRYIVVFGADAEPEGCSVCLDTCCAKFTSDSVRGGREGHRAFVEVHSTLRAVFNPHPPVLPAKVGSAA